MTVPDVTLVYRNAQGQEITRGRGRITWRAVLGLLLGRRVEIDV